MYTIRIGKLYGEGNTSWIALVSACDGDFCKASKIAERTQQGRHSTDCDGAKEWQYYAKNGVHVGRQVEY